MIRRPPRSTLFPTRRSSDLQASLATAAVDRGAWHEHRTGTRSEEHTSELQSRFDLVCRLLLEKKKKTNTKKQTAEEYTNNMTQYYHAKSILSLNEHVCYIYH